MMCIINRIESNLEKIEMPPQRPLPNPPPLPLAERARAVRDEIETLIQNRIAAEKTQNPGLPEQVLRQLFDSKHGICACKAHDLMMFEALSENEREAAREKAQIAAVEKLSREMAEAAASMGEREP